jgi:hypothetical protein
MMVGQVTAKVVGAAMERGFKPIDDDWEKALDYLCERATALRAGLAVDRYDEGRRDILNALLAPNPDIAKRRHAIEGDTEETFTNQEGKLPFDVVFWVTEVAAQLGIEPKGEAERAAPPVDEVQAEYVAEASDV